jgi:pimeloyl-ACP methyl ester carboxylesterase
MPVFERDGIAFNYLDTGEGPPVVIQHGLGGSTDQAVQLFGTVPPFRMLSLDARAHGATEPVGDEAHLSFERFADDVAAMLDEAGVERAAIGGMSMGAGIALAFAHRYPERTAALVLIRPAWLDGPNPENLAFFPVIASLLREFGPGEGMARFRAMPNPLDDNPPGSISMLSSQFLRPHAVARAAVLERMPADCPPRGEPVWGAIAAPALVIATEHDTIHPVEFGRSLAAAIPGARYAEPVSKWIDEDRHNRAVEEAVLAFLHDCEWSAG